MILYRPTDGDVETNPITISPRTCFLMTKLGGEISNEINNMRTAIVSILRKKSYRCIDANSQTTGKDFLLKIWKLAMGVPVGVAIIDSTISSQTMANIFYELGWMQAQGKETIVVKTKDVVIPSDFIRTEYIEFNVNFNAKFMAYLDNLDEQAEYYGMLGDQLENNPLLSIDYLRRAFLITGKSEYQDMAKEIILNEKLITRTKISVESLLAGFATGLQKIK